MIQSSPILNYKIVGKGQPVVFLHGFLEDNVMWKELLPKLHQIKAICIELPGHGASPLLEKDLSLPSIAMAIKSTLDELNLNTFSIVGHSLGGYVTLHLAQFTSLHIQNMILLHSHPWADSSKRKADRNREARVVTSNKLLYLKSVIPNLYHPKNVAQHAPQINRQIEHANTMSIEAIQQNLLAMRDREDKCSVLKKLENQLHIIQGEYDPLIDATEMQKAAQVYHNNYFLIQNIGHMGHFEAKDQVIHQLQSILKAH